MLAAGFVVALESLGSPLAGMSEIGMETAVVDRDAQNFGLRCTATDYDLLPYVRFASQNG